MKHVGRRARRIRSLADVDELLATGASESIDLEFKRDWPRKHGDNRAPSEAMRELCRDVTAFANTWGGTIVVGLGERESAGRQIADQIFPLQDLDGLKQWIHQALENHARPAPELDMRALPVAGGSILAIYIEPFRGLCAVWDPQKHTVQYLRRTDHGKEYMPPSEAFRRTLDRSRAMEIALDRALGTANLNNPAKIMPFGGKGTADARLIVKPDMRNQLLTVTKYGKGSNSMVTIPFGLIDEAWTTVDNRLALMLRAWLVLTPEGLELRPLG